MKKKLLLVTLCLLLLLSTVLVSCGTPSNNGTTTTVDANSGGNATGGAPGETTPPTTTYLDTLPKNDSGYTELHAIAFTTNCIPDEITAEASKVDQELFRRDTTVEELLDLDIKYKEVTTQNAVATMRNSALAGNGAEGDKHQVFFYQAQQLMQLSAEGLLQDLNTVPVLDLDQVWWNQSLNQNMTINGKNYVAAGEWSQWYFGAPIAMAYNKNFAANYEITNIEELVDSGDWTYDALYTLTSVERTINNNVGDSAWNEKDTYAISAYSPALFGLFVSAGGKFSTIDEDGKINVNITDDASLRRIDEIVKAFCSETSYYNADTSDINKTTDVRRMFLNEQALFYFGPLGYCGDFLDATFEYGILPCPKLDESQQEYISCANPQSNFCVGIPTGLPEEEQRFVGLFLEAYGYTSHQYIKPAKYDEFMQLRVSKDEKSAARMDQMFENLYFDINLVMNFGSSRTTLNKGIMDESSSLYKRLLDISVPLINSDIEKILNVTAS